MKEFDALIEVATRLNGPGGCPWDLKQTFFSLQPYVIEEAHEVIEAVDSNDNEKILEELGDLLYTIIFYGKVAEKENRFTIAEILDCVREKLIRRHPHIFGDVQVEHADEVVQNWEKIKKEEKGIKERKSALDGIPKNLPLLVRTQKALKKIRRANSDMLAPKTSEQDSEEEIGLRLLEAVLAAEDSEIDAESALRRAFQNLEERFRMSEELA